MSETLTDETTTTAALDTYRRKVAGRALYSVNDGEIQEHEALAVLDALGIHVTIVGVREPDAICTDDPSCRVCSPLQVETLTLDELPRGTTLSVYRAQVRAVVERHQEEYSWCNSGTEAALRDVDAY